MMILENEIKLDFSDVLIRPKRSELSSRSDVDLVKHFKTKNGNSFSGIPIIAANMATGTFEMLHTFSQQKMFVAISKHLNQKWRENFLEEQYIKYGFYTIGMSDEELDKMMVFHAMLQENHKSEMKICIDIANGYTQKFSSFVSKVREFLPSNVIIAGNVATPEMVQELIIAGADFIKIGIGPGSQCTTRMKTGVGYPQISASIECADAAHGLGGGIILDGGMRTPGDVAKAFCANSDMIMLGGMFAGTQETEGEIIDRVYKTGEVEWEDGAWKEIHQRKSYKVFYGMSSEYAQDKHFGGKKDYRTSEGRVEEVPFVGSATSVIQDLLGGIRSCGTYIGANSIKDFGKCSTLVRVNRIHDRF